MQRFTIGKKTLGEGTACFLVAEMGLGHDGSLGAAHAFIDAAAAAGADAVKFQTHIAEAEGTAQERFRVEVFSQDASRQDYWRRTAFTEEQWRRLQRHASERKTVFLSSPFSIEAVRLLSRVGVPAWKIPSGETSNIPLLREVVKSGLPVLMSTGMSTMEEVDAAVKVVQKAGVPLLLFQCTNRYPCPPEHLGLNMIAEYAGRYRIPVGFSDHSGVPATAIAARVLGACAVEVHVTFSRECFGPDVSSSLTFEEFREVVRGIRFVESALRSPVDKGREAEELKGIRELFTKSIVAAADLSAGTRLTMENLAFKKPGSGMPAAEVGKVLGRTLRRGLKKDDFVTLDNLEATRG